MVLPHFDLFFRVGMIFVLFIEDSLSFQSLDLKDRIDYFLNTNAMKTSSKKGAYLITSCIAILLITGQPAVAHPGDRISFETFYHELEPYGTWIEDRDYGYVWLPDVPRDFHPYVTDGHWIMTEYGNTWVSHYTWGWAPFHYGRWRYDDYYGWMWIPGTEWGPAWVAWRSGGGYYGWAPLGPGVHINISVNIGRYIPDHHWVFVRHGYITHRRVYNYCVPRRNVANIIHHTTIINNTNVYNNHYTYYTGPRTREIERATRQRVQVHSIRQADRPGTTVVRNGAVSVYRPSVEQSRGNFVPASSRNRANAVRQHNNAASTYTNRRGESANSRGQDITTGQFRQRPDKPSITRDTRSNVNTPDRSSSHVSREAESRGKGHTYTRGSSRDRTHAKPVENRNAGARESYSNRDNSNVKSADRSSRTVTPDRRTTPQRGSTYERGQTQRSPSSVKSSGASRQPARQSSGRVSGQRGSSRSGSQR